MEKEKEIIETSAERELMVTRVLNAPRELVWEMWTNPDHIKNWWGPDRFTNTIYKMDVRPGGEWEFVMHGPDGVDYKNKSIFREVVKPERIIFDHISGPKFQATITFSSEGKKTLLTWHMRFESAEQLQKALKRFKADDGLKQNVNKLENYLSKL